MSGNPATAAGLGLALAAAVGAPHLLQRLHRCGGRRRRHTGLVARFVTQRAGQDLGLLGAWGDEAKVDLAPIQIDPADLDLHPGAGGEAHAGAFAAQLLAHLVEAVVLAAQLGDVNQPFNIERIEQHEQAEAGHRADRARKFFAKVLAHVAAFEPRFHIARGLVGTALVGAAMRADDIPALGLGGGCRRVDRGRPARPLRRHRHIHLGRIERVLLARQDALDDPVYQ